MGGTPQKETTLVESNNRKAINNNEEIMNAVVELSRETVDEFPFSARAVMVRCGKSGSSPILGKGHRGGIKQFVIGVRKGFLEKLKKLVEEELNNHGDISPTFCRKLGLLMASYPNLFLIDIIYLQFRTVKATGEVLRPLMRESTLIFLHQSYMY